ncbi:ATPase, T2SS/T4P/T4SS family [Mollicutes bacterium LVI A0078]|nr:ATPase, T2SS/T4P/T4SS family [Mollicutes bacterium LVI A0075]WOO91845.1 ATPase, T2SS/T4P/T4SS family [Mollicutes bacterium LVI A0078]
MDDIFETGMDPELLEGAPIEIENHEVMINGLIEDLQGTVSLDFMGDSFLKNLLLDFREEGISDIKYDGFYLIVESAKRGKYKVVVNPQIMRDVNLLLDELERLNDKVVNMKSPYLDMDVILLGSPTKLRFSVLHETLTNIKGIKSFCIRRNMFAKPVINDDNVGNMVENKPEVIEFIQDMIDINRKPNIVFSGETGSGKTEFQKYIIGQIIPQHGVVSIQDTNDAALKNYIQKRILQRFSLTDSIHYQMGSKLRYVITQSG